MDEEGKVFFWNECVPSKYPAPTTAATELKLPENPVTKLLKESAPEEGTKLKKVIF